MQSFLVNIFISSNLNTYFHHIKLNSISSPQKFFHTQMLHIQEVRKKEENVSDVHWHGFSFNQAYLCIFLHSWHVNHVKLIISDWNVPVTILWNTSTVLLKLLGNNDDRRHWSSSWEPISYLYSPLYTLFLLFPLPS